MLNIHYVSKFKRTRVSSHRKFTAYWHFIVPNPSCVMILFEHCACTLVAGIWVTVAKFKWHLTRPLVRLLRALAHVDVVRYPNP